MKIHKQVLEMTDKQVIELPVDYHILSIQNQNDNICIWYQFEQEITSTKKIIIRGTGIEFDGHGDFHIGTVIVGSYVWHVYDMGWV